MRVLLSVMVVCLVCLTKAPASAEKLRIACESAHPPFSYLDAAGGLVGFDIDIAFALCEAMHAACEVRQVDLADLLPGLGQGRYDMVVASMVKRPEGEEQADFTDSYYHSRVIFLGPAGYHGGFLPKDMEDRSLVTQKGTLYAAYLAKKYAASLVRLTNRMAEALALMVRGEAEFCLVDTLTGYAFLQTPEGRGYGLLGDPVPLEDIPASGASIQVKKGNDALRKRVNEAIRAIWLDGTYSRINRKYFPFIIY